ncbi:MAG: phosphatidylserine decarboxylase family protein [Bacteroidales bacterium]|nr:phosphatidylserine decarboxylase family protein [Bacteroidales bacterium]
MRLHPEGISFVLVTTIICLAGAVLAWLFCKHPALKYTLVALCALAIAMMFMFFRNPDREVTNNPEAIVAPSDGKVVQVRKVFVEEYFGCECTEISIFLSLFDVHINWFPIGGEIVYSKYYPGAHTFAFVPKASEKNEHTSVVVRDAHGREVMFRQIAGIVARRVVSYAHEGAACDQASESGFIKFGSRLTVFVPGDVTPLVKVGDKVKGSVSEIARFN